jgi:urease accessory protein
VLASSTLLTLADGRLPAGGHAHSGGLEEAVASGRVGNASDLAGFLAGQLQTTGRVDAALSALSCWVSPSIDDLFALQAQAIARTPSPAQRRASRAKGRGLLRAAAAMWPPGAVAWLAELSGRAPGGPMYPVAFGSLAASVGLAPLETALVAAQASVTGPAWAATRLLGVDPFAVGRCLAQLAPDVERVAREGGALACSASLAEAIFHLPASSALLSEIGAEAHGAWEVRLFAS